MAGSRPNPAPAILMALTAGLLAAAASFALGAWLAAWREPGPVFPEVSSFYLSLVAIPLATLAGHRLGRFLGRSRKPPKQTSQSPSDCWSNLAGGRACATTLTAAVSLSVALLAVGPVIPPTVDWFDGSLRVVGVLCSAILMVLGARMLLTARIRNEGARIDGALRWLWSLLLVPFMPSSGWLMILFGLAVGALLVATRIRRDRGPSSTRLEIWLFLPLLTLALTYQQASPGPLDLYHLGERVTPASELVSGEAPFRDVHIQHGWIENALRTQVSFALLGDSLESELKGYAFMIAVAHVAFLLLALAALQSWWLAWPLTLALATPGFGLSGRLIGLLLTLTFLLIDLRQARGSRGEPLERCRRSPLWFAGAASGFSLFLSLETGFYALGAGCLFLSLESLGREERVHRRLAPLLHYSLGCLLAAAPFVTALALQGALLAFLSNSIAQVHQQLPAWGLPFPSLSELIAPLLSGSVGVTEWLGSAHLLALVTAAVLIISSTWLLFRAAEGRLDRGSYRVLLLTLAGALLFRSALGRSDAGHFVFSAALLWPLLILLARRWRTWQLLTLGLLAGWMVASHAPLYGMVQQVLRLSYPVHTVATGKLCRLPLPRAGRVLIPIYQARPLASLASYLDERLLPREAIFDFSNVGAAYFLLQRDCPTRFFVPLYAASEEQQWQLIEELERVRPRFVLRNCPLGLPQLDGRGMEQRLPVVADYLERVYAPGEQRSFGEILERRSLSAPEAFEEQPDQPGAPLEEALRQAVAHTRANAR